MKIAALLSLLMFFLFVAKSQIVNVYVSPMGNDRNRGLSADAPFATLQHAVDITGELRKNGKINGPVNILLGGGTYQLTEPVKIGPGASGTSASPLTIRSSGKQQAKFNGARPIRGWKKYNKNIWMASIPEALNGRWKFHQLFVNGRPGVPARTPNEGFFKVTGFPDGVNIDYHAESNRFQYRPGDINPSWKNIGDVRVIVYHFWTDTHLQIDSINVKKNIVRFRYPADKRFTDDFSSEGARYIVENVFEALDTPGEWYLDSKEGVVYYMPRQEEKMEADEILAPVADGFINFMGDPQSGRVENIAIENIAFEYSNFMLPEGDQNSRQGSMTIPGSIKLRGASNISFKDCTFTNLGNFAFDIQNGCSDVTISQNRIEHLAAGVCKINGGDESEHPLQRTKKISITDNEIGYYGEVYPSAVGILIRNAEGCYVGHNHIHHGWYTGISVGWVWGYERSISRDNIIEYNHIHDIGQGLLSDMGAIYTLGVSPGTVIRNNLIHDIESNKYGGWGIYNDEGSTHILIENNIVYNTKYAGYDIHYAKEITTRNNIFALGRLEEINRTQWDPHTSVYFENNIVYWKDLKDPYSANWRDKNYTFHVNPNIKDQPIKTSTFDADYNIFYCPGVPVDSIRFNGNTWDAWHKRGKDVHSLYTDPLFKDIQKYDYTLLPKSPALKLGFRNIDMKEVGPRHRLK
jgi:hypothetical protein